MRAWPAQHIAACADATVLAAPDTDGGPERAVIDSRQAGPGDLFFGLPGASDDGGRFADQALRAGAWGVLTTPQHADTGLGQRGVVLAADDPLRALHRPEHGDVSLARA